MGSHSRTGSHRVNARDEEYFREHGHTRVPSLVQWMATLRCSLSCAHCLAAVDEDFGEMVTEEAMGLVDQVSGMGVREFLLTGGEPLEREDIHEVIRYMARRKLPWSLNTSVMPSAEQRKVMEAFPPGFVAVSLDGPEEVHDSFRGRTGAYREAMDSIDYFTSLRGTRVCAGTTVTSINYPYLNETFALAVSSGAHRWGIHLLLPEGRAALRPGLFLSRKKLGGLIRFVARKRRYFDVEMADEAGYLGDMEPLVRDRPLVCGAGRSQCVILPDGEVVPCTTLDRSTSAGSIHDRPLFEIWRGGFRELREWESGGRCRDCAFAPACGGGCWLQRRAGAGCYRDEGHLPGILRTAVGIIVCMGLASAVPSAAGQGPVTTSSEAAEERDLEMTRSMERAILEIYSGTVQGHEVEVAPMMPEDPGWRFVAAFAAGSVPGSLSARCRLVREALGTGCRSLSLLSLMWRSISQPMLDGGTSYAELGREEKSLVSETLELLRQAARKWRPEFLRNSLMPFIGRGEYRGLPHFMMSKAGPGPGQLEEYALSRDLTEERLGALSDTSLAVTREYLQRHRFAEGMDIVMECGRGSLFLQRSGEGTEDASRMDGGVLAVGVFSIVSTGPDGAGVSLVVECQLGDAEEPPEYADVMEEQQGTVREHSMELSVSLEGGREYSWADLVREVHLQNRTGLDETAVAWMSGEPFLTDEDGKRLRIVRVSSNEALLWPSVRRLAGLEDEDAGHATVHRARLKDADMWMF